MSQTILLRGSGPAFSHPVDFHFQAVERRLDVEVVKEYQNNGLRATSRPPGKSLEVGTFEFFDHTPPVIQSVGRGGEKIRQDDIGIPDKKLLSCLTDKRHLSI